MENKPKSLITNKKERRRVLYSLMVFGLVIAFIIYLLVEDYFQLNVFSYGILRQMEGAGPFGAYAFTFSIAMYVIRRVIKRIGSKELKQKLLVLARILREWHVPISIIGFSVILLHAYIMLSKGFLLDLRYACGIIALSLLAVQMLSGIVRYKRKAVKFHMIMGIIFIITMLIHIIA